ncbi:winged helix-turn-helix domain-containing protein [Thalassomonas viridans]|uniref:Winged helix-turn-helix domain-containing protein n=1 Tax=Thalassomonas viridans TaxID=137584 RepID=A0AAE9Z9C9_9GAMM|nr:winged helix-turn-helix domain-containing protein [Thalassomonas viridans]
MQYQIGPWLFSPARCLLTSNEIERELEPLVFKLLTYFIAQQERIIPRQELVEQVWQQSFVDDNAINRAISELRKQLKHPVEKAPLIKTHYRKGYSLTVTVTEVTATSAATMAGTDSIQPEVQVTNGDNAPASPPGPAVQAAEPARENTEQAEKPLSPAEVKTPAQPHFLMKKPWWLLIAFLLLLTALIATRSTLSISLDSNSGEKATQSSIAENVAITAETWNPGAESTPLLSPDGKLFAYSNQLADDVTSFIKRIDDQREIKLQYQDMEVAIISWQPQSRILLTELTNASRKDCHYALFDIANFPEVAAPRLVKTCNVTTRGGAQLSRDGQWMYYSQYDESKEGIAIYRYDLASGKSTMVVPSGDKKYGAIYFELSPDGESLAYIWLQESKPAKIYALGLQTRETQMLYQMQHNGFTYAIDWQDNQHLVIADGNTLHTINLDTAAIKSTRIEQDFFPYHLSVEGNNKLLFSTQGGSRYQIEQITNAFSGEQSEPETLYPSDKSNYYVSFRFDASPDRFFISYRSGYAQIWQAEQDNLVQLSDFPNGEGQRLNRLILSHDGRFLLFNRNEQMEFIELATKKLHQLKDLSPTHISSYAWSADDRAILYSTAVNGVSQIWRYDLLTRENKQLTQRGGNNLLDNGAGDIYYINDEHLISLDGSSKTKITTPKAPCWCSNALTENYLYSSDRFSTIYRMELSSGKIDQVPTPYNHSGINVSADDKIITYTKITPVDTQIQRISWQ